MPPRHVITLLCLLTYLVATAAPADVLARKKFRRRFPIGWCPIESSFENPFYVPFTADGGTARISFSARNLAAAGLWNNHRLDAVAVVELGEFLAPGRQVVVEDCYQADFLGEHAVTLFAASFESGLNSMTLDNTFGDGGGLWSRTTACQAADPGHSPPFALAFTDPATCTYDAGAAVEGVVVSPTVAVPGEAGTLLVELDYALATEGGAADGFDVASVALSADGGPFVTVADNDPNRPIEQRLADPSDGWRSLQVPVFDSGSTSRLRIGFRTNDDVANDLPGFAVDDLSLRYAFDVKPTSTLDLAAVDPAKVVFLDRFVTPPSMAWSGVRTPGGQLSQGDQLGSGAILPVFWITDDSSPADPAGSLGLGRSTDGDIDIVAHLDVTGLVAGRQYVLTGWWYAAEGPGDDPVQGDLEIAVESDGPPTATCVPSATALCLQGGRFRVEVDWRIANGTVGTGKVVPGVSSADSGLFWFFNPNNWEMLVKVLNNCNGATHRFWVFSAATTNVEYTLRVTDTVTGEMAEYFNPLGTAAAAITDTDAFATCP